MPLGRGISRASTSVRLVPPAAIISASGLPSKPKLGGKFARISSYCQEPGEQSEASWDGCEALKGVNRNAVVLATAFVGLFVVLDLAVTWSHYASVLTLYHNYSTATNDTHRAGYVAAANYASAMLTSPLEIVYAIVTLSFGILLTGFVMLRGAFNKITAYLGLATGILGILSLTGLSLIIIGNALFATAWLFFVAYRLYRLAQE